MLGEQALRERDPRTLPRMRVATWNDVVARLREQHGDLGDSTLPLGNKPDPYDELIYILLTVMTRSQPRIDRAFQGLRELAGDGGWAGILVAGEDELREVLEPLGFVNRRSQQLRGTVRRIESDLGGSLDSLRDLTDEEALDYLTSLPGVGTKSAKCVLMYSLRRPVLPVDIHVLRVAKRIGLVDEAASWEEAAANLDRDVEAHLKFAVHVYLVMHGREVCKGPNPQCHDCSLLDMCPTGPDAARLRSVYAT
jgi:endonuclease III